MNTHEDRARRTDRILNTSAPGWRTQRRRRALAVATILVVLADLVVAHLSTGQLWTIAGMVVGTLGFVSMRVLTRGVAERTDGTLDERDRALRDKVVRWSFAVAPAALFLIAAYVGCTEGLPGLADRVTNLALVSAWASLSTPTLLLAWILPDDDLGNLD